MDNLIRSEREARDWTRAALAERLEVSRHTVVAIEPESTTHRSPWRSASLPLAFRIAPLGRSPSPPLAFRVAHLVDTPIEELFTPPRRSAVSGR